MGVGGEERAGWCDGGDASSLVHTPSPFLLSLSLPFALFPLSLALSLTHSLSLSLPPLSLTAGCTSPPPPSTRIPPVPSPPFSFTGTIANKAQEARGNNRSVMPLDAFYWAARVLQWREQYVDANSEMKRQPCEAPSWLGSSLATIGRELGMPRKHVLVIAC